MCYHNQELIHYRLTMKVKATKQAHTPDTKIGMGDYYGVAVKNKIVKPREIMMQKVMPKKKTTKPPRSLA